MAKANWEYYAYTFEELHIFKEGWKSVEKFNLSIFEATKLAKIAILRKYAKNENQIKWN